MTRSILLAATLASGLALAACNREVHDEAPAGNAAADVAAAAAAIRADETQWNADFAARDVERLVGHYAADATVATPGAAVASGSAAIRTDVTAIAADPAFRITFASDRVEVSGDLAYSRGHYEMTATDPATRQPATHRGAYLTVWRRQDDGSWKAVEDFLTAGPAAAAAAPEAATPPAEPPAG